MSVTPWGTAAELTGKVIDKIWPGEEQKALRDEAKAKLLEAQQRGDLRELEIQAENALQQIELNKLDARSESRFQSGWRPAIGWICATALFYKYLIYPTVAWVAAVFAPDTVPPELDMMELLTLLGGMLGFGGLRTFEKLRGVNKRR